MVWWPARYFSAYHYIEGRFTTVTAEEQGIPASELAAAMNKIKELQRLLGKKTMVNELLKEAVISGLHYTY